MVSRARKTLSEQSHELRNLASSVRAVTRLQNTGGLFDSASEYWFQQVNAPSVLERDVTIQRWALAEHFTKTWIDYQRLAERWQKYFGQRQLPKTWKTTVDRSGSLSATLLRDRGLAHAILTGWRRDLEALRIEQDRLLSASDSFHALLDSLQNRALAAGFLKTDNTVGKELMDLAVSQQERCIEDINRSEREFAEELRFYARNYRHATLNLSWLSKAEDREWWDQLGSLEMSIADRLEIRELSEKQRIIAKQIIDRISAAIAEIGYEALFDDVLSGDFQGGVDSPTGVSDINVIPSRTNAACRPTLLAMSRGAGKRSRLAFPRILEQVKTHLYRCKDTTNLVILMCDHWDSKAIEQDHLTFLRECHNAGVRFVFLLIGPNGCKVSPISVELS